MRMFIFWNSLTTLCLIFAVVQLNDPDPWVWFCSYVINAIILVFASFKKISLPLSVTLCIAYLIFAYLHWPTSFEGFMGDMETHPHIELAREATGLLLMSICQGGVIYYNIHASKNSGITI